MHIAYYITGHGYGHALRSTTIARQLSKSTQLTIVSAVPEQFFIEELQRPFSYRPESFDCGCLQIDSVTVDVAATVRAYSRIAAENRLRLDSEVAWCRSRGITGIVGDIPPFAFEVARAAGLPSVAVTNFTWYDIYSEYNMTIHDATVDLEEIRTQYASATRLFALSPALPMAYFPNRVEMPVVGRRGTPRRNELNHRFAIPAEKKLALIYIGDFGMSKAAWDRLAAFTDWEFFGLQEITDAPQNYHRLIKTDMWYPDIVAAADCVISKLGYGVVAECMVNGTPIIYLPRPLFAEYPVLEQAVVAWGGGVQLPADVFNNLDWASALDLVSHRERPFPIMGDGAAQCAAAIERVFL